MKKVVAFALALSMVMVFAVSFAAEVPKADEVVADEVVADVATPTTVEAPEEAPVIEVSGSKNSVIINGIEYCYVTFTEQAKWVASGGAVYWARIYKNEAYLFSMVSGSFVGKYDTKLLSYVEFTTEKYPNFSQLALVMA